MPTTFYCSDGSVQGEPRPNVFVNPYGWTLQTATSYAGAGEEGRLEATNQGVASHRDMASPATIGYYRMTRFASKPLEAQTILAQTIQVRMAGFEDLATANAEWAIQLFVWKSDDTGVRGQLLALPTQFTEMNADAETETSASGTSTQVVCQDGDKLVLEIYYSKTAAKLEALSRHHYGPADVSGYTSRIIFANDVGLQKIAKAFSDSGHGTDSFSKTVTLLNKGFSDSGHGSDNFGVFITFLNKAFADSGLGSDGFTNPYRAMGFSDSSLVSDQFAIPFKAKGFSDAGLGSDAFVNPFRAVGFSDAGIGADTFQKQVLPSYISKDFVDSGSGADSFTAVTTFQTKAFSETASGSDQFTNPFRALGFSDSGLGVDSLSKTITFQTKSFSDSALGTDVFSIIRMLGFSDSAVGVDSFIIPFKALQFSDVGNGFDVFSKSITFLNKAFSDAGVGADAFSLMRIIAFSDAGLGSDAFAVSLKAMGFSDGGTGLDTFAKTIIVVTAKAFADNGVGNDSYFMILLPTPVSGVTVIPVTIGQVMERDLHPQEFKSTPLETEGAIKEKQLNP